MENKSKELLKSYRRMKKEIEAIEASIRELRTNKIMPSLIQDGMPHGSGCSDLSAYAAKLDELERKMEDKRWKALYLYEEIEGYIMELPDETERALCRFRYITGMQWEEICVTMGYGWAQIHRIHSKALKEIEGKIQQNQYDEGKH